MLDDPQAGAIAVVGMAGRFPGAADLEAFWHNLRDGVEAISFFGKQDLADQGLDPALLKDPRFVPAGAYVEHSDCFDAAFFGYAPREAELLDPQQRLFLECAWQALEHAGYPPTALSIPTGVYAGASLNSYLLLNLASHPHISAALSRHDASAQMQLSLASSPDFLTTRVSYKLNLRGPSHLVQSACSTSLVAVHIACQGLLNEECDLALAGGVSLNPNQRSGYLYQPDGIVSPDGHCRAFDAAAQGTVLGSGVGIVVLKRLADALDDGDTIYAVILGSAVNNDGAAKAGFAAPSVEGQARVVAEALATAGVAPETISYVEAHGTGTPLGDVLELAALTQAFRAGTARSGYCAIGSVKTNIGHLDAAAGIASLLKTILALHHQQLPPSLHFEQPNPQIDFASSPFFVNTQLQEWRQGVTQRRAGINAFGMGGTNAHVILEEAPRQAPTGEARPWQLLVLSAKTATALETAKERVATHLRRHEDQELADIAYTLQVGRAPLAHRLALVCRDHAQALDALEGAATEQLWSSIQPDRQRSMVFVLPGESAYCPGLGRELYQAEPAFRAALNRCAALLQVELHEILHPGDHQESVATDHGQLTAFVVEYALAQLWMSWGVRPQALVGVGVGLHVAACLAGVLTLEEALALVAATDEAARQSLFQRLRPRPPTIPCLSPRAGAWMSADEATDWSTWTQASGDARNLAEGVGELAREARWVFVELGPGGLLGELALPEGVPAIASLGATGSEQAALLGALGRMWLAGVTVNWAGLHSGQRRRRVPMPTYPFERSRFWIEPYRPAEQGAMAPSEREGSLHPRPAGLGAYVAPQTTIEQTLAATWEATLGVGPIGTMDDFLALGGHSLLATQVVARLREALAIELPLRELFEAPSVAALAVRVAALQQQAPEPAPPIVPVARDGDPSTGSGQGLPLSFAQQRFWFLDQMAPGASAYTVAEALDVTGPLDIAALEASLDALVVRHEVLRTTFVARDGQPLQRIAPTPAPVLEIQDLQSGTGAGDDTIERLLQADAHRPFDLARGPLLRVTLLRRAPDDHVVLLAIHHSIADGWSMGIFVQELAAFYAAYVAGQPVDLPKLQIQYADYAAWQREWLQEAAFERHLDYWRRHLADLPALELPTDYARLPAQTFHGARQSLVISPALTQALQALSRDSGGTLFMTLLAALQVLLYRLTGQTDLVVGTRVAGRTRAEIAPLIGCFVNTLVLRADLAGSPTVCELLARARALTLDAYTHQEVPFEQVVTAVDPDRDLSRQPLFQVMVVLQNFPLAQVRLPDLTLTPRAFEPQTAMYDLDLTFTEVDGALHTVLDYSTDLFAPQTAARLLAQLQTVLTEIAADPARHIDALPLLEVTERRQVLHAWNGAAAAYPHDTHLAALFAAQAARTPDAIALMFDHREPRTKNQEPRTKNQEPSGEDSGSQFSVLGSEQGSQFSILNSQFSYVTYAELNGRANQLAHYLRRLGVAPEVAVGVGMERGLPAFVALLAILKAGGVFVPLDPAAPPAYLSAILAASRAAVLLTTQEQRTTERKGVLHTPPADDERAYSTAPPADPGQPTVIDLVADWERIAQEPATNPDSSVTADHLSHIVYTSGSTGRPKGVAVPQRQLLNRLAWQWRRYPFAPGEVAGQRTPLTVSVALAEALAPLLAGVPTLLLADAVIADGARLVATLAERRVTRIVLVPTLLREVLDALAAQGGRLPELRLWVVCGEVLPPALAARFAALLPHATLLNQYGASEINDMTVYDTGGLDQRAPRVPVGRPIDNLHVYVLDGQMQPVPVGVPGQVYVGGAGLARGYIGQADLTAERFVPNPFAENKEQRTKNKGLKIEDRGLKIEDSSLAAQEKLSSILHPPSSTRLYAMGDLARWRSDGTLEYLGRRDQQVKLRGVRVDLAEIEALLLRHAGVAQAAVVARREEGRDTEIVAYVVPNQEPRTKNQEPEDPTGGSQFSVLGSGDGSRFSVLGSVELRRYLADHLPAGQVPGRIVMRAALPRTASGKIARQALVAEAAALAPPAANAEADAPRTPLEDLLAGIWAAVLGLERVGRATNFFELGGHSLLAMQVIGRMQAVCGVALAPRTMFEAPTVAELAAQLEAAREDAAPPPPIAAAPRNPDPSIRQDSAGRGHTHPPLSFAQQRLWFLDQLDPGQPFYSVPAAVRISGPLRATILEASLGAVVARHEILRTRFEIMHEQPVQLIAHALAVALPVVDLRGLPAADREAGRLTQAEARRPFDLARGPLIRATLLRLAADEHVLLLTLHHIIADGWSVGILVRELSALYTAFSAPLSAPSAPLSALPVQYADYTVWQREWLAEAGEPEHSALQRHLAYWRKQLQDLPTLELPLDHARPAGPTSRGATHSFTIPPALRDQLSALARREGVTLFMTLLAAFDVLLARYSEQDNIVVGSPIAGRTRPEIEGLIGFFANTQVLRCDLSGNPTFLELLGRVRAVCLAAYAHQELPFEKLVEELQPQRDAHRQPLFQVLFALQNAPMPELAVAGLTLRPLPIERETATFELSLNLVETPDGISGSFEYATDLFAAPTIARMAGHFETLLAEVAADPARPIMWLPLLTTAERRLTPGQARASYPQTACLHRRFEAQAARSPDAIATVCGAEHLTYAALNRRSNRLARYLRAHGVGPETPVALCLERSLDLVVAILGVLKAGGAYVPLDPAYPTERLAWMLEDAQAAVLLTTEEQRTKNKEQKTDSTTDRKGVLHTPPANDERAYSTTLLANPGQSNVVDLIADWPTIAQQPETNLDGDATPDNLAYVIYTSGSTGKPKGVLVAHANVGRLFDATQPWFQFDGRDIWTLFHSYAFDFSVWELWGALLYGGQLVVVPDAVRRAPDAFAALLAAQQVTVLNQTPSAFDALTIAARAALPALRYVIFGGEALDLARLRPWFARHGDARPRLINMYGITETTVHVTYRPLTEADSTSGAGSLIGQAIGDLAVYVLDAHMQPVPLGVPGELYVGGAGLARGYLNRPDLTAERFVPDPFTENKEQRTKNKEATSQTLYGGPYVGAPPTIRERGRQAKRRGRAGEGETAQSPISNLQSPISNLQSPISDRLYKTGDRARYRATGELEYLGRLDQQVKIRGYRVELGEIEAVLIEHPAVRAGAVVARRDGPGGVRLVAYVVPDQEQRTKNKEQNGEQRVSQFSILNSQFSGELRQFLRDRLPDYMVPAAFVLLDALPLTAQGKLDRRALPAPETQPAGRAQPSAAPRTPVELQLAAIWQELLELADVGIDDNFFELGGHSLLLTQLAARIQSTFQISLPLRVLFDAPTIVDMTIAIADVQIGQADAAELAQLAQALDQLSEEEIAALLAGD